MNAACALFSDGDGFFKSGARSREKKFSFFVLDWRGMIRVVKHLNSENELKVERGKPTCSELVGVGLAEISEAALHRGNLVEMMITVCFLTSTYPVYHAIL
jgi:hypothetical protein